MPRATSGVSAHPRATRTCRAHRRSAFARPQRTQVLFESPSGKTPPAAHRRCCDLRLYFRLCRSLASLVPSAGPLELRSATTCICVSWLPCMPDERLLLANTRLLDGSKDLRHIVIDSGRVASIKSIEDVEPTHDRRVDLAGRFLCPGLCDNHVRLERLSNFRSLGRSTSRPGPRVSARSRSRA